MSARRRYFFVAIVASLSTLILINLTSFFRTSASAQSLAAAEKKISVQGGTPVENGHYIVAISGCNDCHTPGYMETNGQIPESEWLTGVPLGWRGPWGTTYASNLRIFAQDFDLDTFCKTLRSRQVRPIMPWYALHHMHEDDLKAVYAYIKSLPVKGEKMPAFVPPDQEPGTPYFSMIPMMPATQPAKP